jgi:prepilin-type N-terminal cleavage/methylation domain-containing protein
MNKLLKRQGGFTLLELLIVIVIIGILAVLIVPNLTQGPQRARDSQRKSDLRNVKTALETYFNDGNSYPNVANYAALTVLTPNQIKTLPVDPKGGTAAAPGYSYAATCSGSPVSCTSYVLTATLENSSDPQGPTYTVNSVN